MKRKFILAIVSMIMASGVAFSQTQTIVFDDLGQYGGTSNSGTFNPTSTFNFNVNLTFSGYTAVGYSLWLEVPVELAPYITITSESYFTFTNPTDNGFPKAFTDTSGASIGFRTDIDTVVNPQSGTIDSGDLGATGSVLAAGTYSIANIQFSLSGAPAGTYTLQSTTLSPKVSIVSDSGFGDHALSVATYSITVVPEPGTWSLIGLGGLGALGLNLLRAKRKS